MRRSYLRTAVLAASLALAVSLSAATAQARVLGAQAPAKTEAYAIGQASRVTYPSSYDLRTLGKVSPVEDQGDHNTCWAFAALGSLESCMLPADTVLLSEDNLALNSGFDLGSYGGGNLFVAGAYLASWAGPVLASQDAYGDNYTPPGLSAAYHVQDIALLPKRANQHDNGAIKSALMKYGAVYASVHSPADEQSWLDVLLNLHHIWNPDHNAYYYRGSGAANHAVDIVGWDDKFSRDNFATKPPGDGAFIARNSWGTGWGESGYLYVSYYDTSLARKAWSAVFDGAEPADNFSDIYQYDQFGWLGWKKNVTFGYSSNTAWFANDFTAKKSDRLSAVSFWVVGPRTSYKIYASTGAATPLTAEGSGTFQFAGYHTVDLATPMQLAAGQRFRVAVKVTTPGSKANKGPIPLETRQDGWSSNAGASRKQSFVSRDGRTWTDLTTVNGQRHSNVCLKAFTRPSTTSKVGAPFAVCIGPQSKEHPAIAGDWVVWEDYRSDRHNIFAFNLGTKKERLVTSAGSGLFDPAISGTKVVWQDGRYQNWTIFGSDFSSGREFAVCDVLGGQGNPSISGNTVVWADWRYAEPYDDNGHVYGLNLTSGTEFPVCTTIGGQWSPSISGSFVVWCDGRNDPDGVGNSDIYGKNLSTGEEFPICTAPGDQWDPAISGNIVVWVDDRNGGDNAIYGYDLATRKGFVISTSAASHVSPAVSGGVVVWEDDRTGIDSIWGYDIATAGEFPIRVDSKSHYDPAISGKTVVWLGEGGLNIYGCHLQ